MDGDDNYWGERNRGRKPDGNQKGELFVKYLPCADNLPAWTGSDTSVVSIQLLSLLPANSLEQSIVSLHPGSTFPPSHSNPTLTALSNGAAPTSTTPNSLPYQAILPHSASLAVALLPSSAPPVLDAGPRPTLIRRGCLVCTSHPFPPSNLTPYHDRPRPQPRPTNVAPRISPPASSAPLAVSTRCSLSGHATVV